MKEATLRDYLLGAVSADALVAEIDKAVEPSSRGGRRRVHIEDLPEGERVNVTAPMLVRLCDTVLAGELPASALETIAFAIIASDRLRWDQADDLVARVLYDWASPEINSDLTPGSVRMFRDWLTGEVSPPSEPEVTTDTLAHWGFMTRIEKVRVPPSSNAAARTEAYGSRELG